MTDSDIVMAKSQELERYLQEEFGANGESLRECVMNVIDHLPLLTILGLNRIANICDQILLKPSSFPLRINSEEVDRTYFEALCLEVETTLLSKRTDVENELEAILTYATKLVGIARPSTNLTMPVISFNEIKHIEPRNMAQKHLEEVIDFMEFLQANPKHWERLAEILDEQYGDEDHRIAALSDLVFDTIRYEIDDDTLYYFIYACTGTWRVRQHLFKQMRIRKVDAESVQQILFRTAQVMKENEADWFEQTAVQRKAVPAPAPAPPPRYGGGDRW